MRVKVGVGYLDAGAAGVQARRDSCTPAVQCTGKLRVGRRVEQKTKWLARPLPGRKKSRLLVR